MNIPYQKGNTQLRPQYTNSIAVTNTFKYRLTTTLNYSHISDVFSQLIDTAEKSKAFITKKNLADQDIVSLNISMPFQYKWYSVFANVNTYYSKIQGRFWRRPYDQTLDVFAVNVYAQQSFKLGKKDNSGTQRFYISLYLAGYLQKQTNVEPLMPVFSKRSSKGKGTVKANRYGYFPDYALAAPAILPAST